MSPFWGFLKTAATNIPWGKVAQRGAPVILELFGRARERFAQHDAGQQKSLDDQLKLLQEENARLAAALLQVSDHVQRLGAQVSLLTKVTWFSLVLALSSLVAWLVRS